MTYSSSPYFKKLHNVPAVVLACKVKQLLHTKIIKNFRISHSSSLYELIKSPDISP